MWFNKENPTGALWNEEDLNDPRNIDYERLYPSFGSAIPDEGNILPFLPRIRNQGQTSACTAFATVGAWFLLNGQDISERYVFHRIKTDSKYPSHRLDYGAYALDPVKLVVNEGACDYSLCPVVLTRNNQEFIDFVPTQEMHQSAKKNAGGAYVYPTTSRGSLDIFDATVRYMHEQRRPVVIGYHWQQNWNGYATTRKTGIFPARFVEGPGTGHLMYAVAWKMINGEPYLGCVNSWGEGWGDNGLAWVPRNFSKLYSPIGILPVETIEKEVSVDYGERNAHKERANAQELHAIVQVKFPLNVEPKARALNAIAVSLFEKEKIMLAKATSYLGWKFTDVVNYLYARSRGKVEEQAFNLNFKIYREDFFSK